MTEATLDAVPALKFAAQCDSHCPDFAAQTPMYTRKHSVYTVTYEIPT